MRSVPAPPADLDLRIAQLRDRRSDPDWVVVRRADRRRSRRRIDLRLARIGNYAVLAILTADYKVMLAVTLMVGVV